MFRAYFPIRNVCIFSSVGYFAPHGQRSFAAHVVEFGTFRFRVSRECYLGLILRVLVAAAFSQFENIAEDP